MMRLDKYLSNMGKGTRSEIKKLIRQGAVTVDGVPAKSPEMKIDEERQTVCLHGVSVAYEAHAYYMLYKPAGYVSASRDPREKTVVDLLSGVKKDGLFPAGRLDKDTEGLLLITDDGELAHNLLSPRKHVDKVYEAVIDGVVDEDDIKRFKEGIDIGDEKPALPAELVILEAGIPSRIRLTIREGRFHQVKRMFQAVGKPVMYLKRISLGSLILDESLSPGEYRKLTKEELKMLC